jgi:hypothetical protein
MLPGKSLRTSFYDDPGVQSIEQAFSFPGSNPVQEAYALYQYELSQAGFLPQLSGWQDFNSWFNSLR